MNLMILSCDLNDAPQYITSLLDNDIQIHKATPHTPTTATVISFLKSNNRSIMKKVLLSLALLLLPSQLMTVEGFATSVRAVPSAFTTTTTTTTAAVGSSPSIQLHHHVGDNDIEHHDHDYDTSLDNKNNNNNNNAWNKKKRALHTVVVNMAVATTLSVGLLFSSTTFVPAAVAADNSAVKDADIVDFSMPSYQDASRAAVNSNLKGEKFLLGDNNFEKLR